MSISTVRTFMEKSGCGYVVGGGLALVLVLGIVYSGGQCGGGQEVMEERRRDDVSIVAVVGEGRIYAEDIDEAARAQTEQIAQQIEVLPPEFIANAKAYALGQMIDELLILHMARQRGVKLTDEDLMGFTTRSLDEAITQQRRAWEAEGRLQPGHSDADFDALVKEQTGRTVQEIKDQNVNELKESLQDESRRDRHYAAYAAQAYVESERGKIQPSDEELRLSFNTYTYRRVALAQTATQAEAQKILGEIRGGLPFQTAVTRYSTETPDEGQRVADLTTRLTHDMVAGDPTYKPLLNLSEGGVSEVIMLPSGPAIYQLVSVQSAVPDDLEKTIDIHRREYATRMAQQQFRQELEKTRESTEIEWRSEGFHVLFDWSKVNLEMMAAPPEQREKAGREIMERAARAIETDQVPMGNYAAALTYYAALDAVWTGADEATRASLRPERIESIQRLLEQMESVELRLSLVEIHVAEKESQAASRELLEAARSNTTLGPMGQQFYSEINTRMDRLRNQNLLDSAIAEQIEREQERWRQNRAEQEKYEEEQRRQEEEARKQQEAEEQKQQAPVERPSPTTTGGTTGQ